MLILYLATALAITKLTWNDWWADARLARLAHMLDIAVFTVLVLATDGYTSPFFVFCVFMILFAAIRWGWRSAMRRRAPRRRRPSNPNCPTKHSRMSRC